MSWTEGGSPTTEPRADGEPSSHTATSPGRPSATAGPSIHALLGGRFLLDRELGRGGSGRVFAARDLVLGQRVAVKVLHADRLDAAAQERLRREVSAARPGHPHAVAVYELHETDGHTYLTLELVDGTSLRSELTERGPLTVERVVELGRQVSEALASLHGRGLVHRDVKPGNILLATSGAAKLCDLGLVRPVTEGVTITETEMVVGTPAYMAPEQALGGELLPASDVYSLGVTLFQALTGEVPLRADTALGTLNRRQVEAPPSIRSAVVEAPRWLDRLLQRMLDPDPRARPSAEVVARALATRRSPWRPSRRQLLAAAIIVVALVATLGVIHWRRATRTIQIQVARDSANGLARDGSPTWSRRFSLPLFKHEIVDLDGDGRDEVVLATQAVGPMEGREGGGPPAELEIRRLDGKVVTRLTPDDVVQWAYPYPVHLGIDIEVLDVDHDGVLEVVAICTHTPFYPSSILVYWTRAGRWDHVLNHSGRIYHVTRSRAEDGPGLWLFAVNNELGVLPVIARLALAGGTNRRASSHALCASPPTGPVTQSGTSLSPYVLLPEPRWGTASIRFGVDTNRGGVVLETPDGSRLALDPLGNPVPGPSAGLDLRPERDRFARGLARLTADNQAQDPEHVRRDHAEIAEMAGRLMLEEPYRVVLEVMTARALARAGDLEGGLELLRDLVATSPWDEPVLRRAHLEALAGNAEVAADLLWDLSQRSQRPRANYDAPLLAVQVAIVRRDEARLAQAVEALVQHRGAQGRVLREGLMAEARLWWDRLVPGDTDLAANGYLPAVEAVACLSRWRSGRLRPEDAESMARGARENPDVETHFHVAEIAALLGTGRATEALERLERLEVVLVLPAREDLTLARLLELARALRVLALADSGHRDRARELATDLRARVDPELLPGILVAELLASLAAEESAPSVDRSSGG